MTSTTVALSLRPFLPLRSFMAYAVGEEKIEVRTGALLNPASVAELRKAAA